MKKTLLVGINAKYIHSNIAIRYIKAYMDQGDSVELKEFSINQNIEYILEEMIKVNAEIIGFSCYLWNIEMVRKLSRNIKLIYPEVTIVYGGPEVTYTSIQEMERNPYVDIIVEGEGEKTFADLQQNLDHLEQIDNITYRQGPKLIRQKKTAGISLDDVVFPYNDGFELLENRIIYYETSRGCPFKCQYCLSSIEKGVRFRSMEKVHRELQFFLDAHVKQVKFVDRTFNAWREHALSIMNYIIDHDQGWTNFHFEVAPELIDQDFLEVLSRSRNGLFQLEIGVQSSHRKTLDIIQRRNDLEKIVQVVSQVKALENTHIHLDLIAGLPEENLHEFKNSFDYVYEMKPDQFQLGFLKILKGAGLYDQVKEYGIQYRDYPPYEVLSTEVLAFGDVMELKIIEEMVETFYNSGLFRQTIKRLAKLYARAYNLYEALGRFWIQENMHHEKHTKLNLYHFMYLYIQNIDIEVNEKTTIIQWLQMDYVLNEKPKKKKEWMTFDFIEAECQRYLLDILEDHHVWEEERKKYTTKQLSRMYHIDRLENENVLKKMVFSHVIEVKAGERYAGSYILVNYHRRDFLHNNGEALCINLI